MDDVFLYRSYEDELQTFRVVVRHILEHGELPSACLYFDLALIQVLGDIVRAVRDGSPTHALVRDACRAFGEYASRTDANVRQQTSPSA